WTSRRGPSARRSARRRRRCRGRCRGSWPLLPAVERGEPRFGLRLAIAPCALDGLDAAEDFILDDALAHAEPFGDFALRKPFDLAHPNDAAATFRQAVDQRQHAAPVDAAAGLALRGGAQVILIRVDLGK